MALRSETQREQKYTTTNQKGPEAHSVYDLPSVEALVRYMHAAAGSQLSLHGLKQLKMVTLTHGQD